MMGELRDAKWYDDVYSSSPMYTDAKAEDLEYWWALWSEVARIAHHLQPDTVCDLGSGPGFFLAALERCGWLGTQYTGLDFSEVAVALSRQRAKTIVPHKMPRVRYEVADLRTCDIPAADLYVCTETLEHVEDDIGLLRRLHPGSLVLFSVPNYDSEGHVRWFPDLVVTVAHYGQAVDIEQAKTMEVGDKLFHVVMGKTRGR